MAWDLGLGAAATSQYYHFMKKPQDFSAKMSPYAGIAGFIVMFSIFGEK